MRHKYWKGFRMLINANDKIIYIKNPSVPTQLVSS